MGLEYEGVLLVVAIIVFSHAEHLETEARIEPFRDIITLSNLERGIASAVAVGMTEYFDEQLFPEAAGPVGRMDR